MLDMHKQDRKTGQGLQGNKTRASDGFPFERTPLPYRILDVQMTARHVHGESQAPLSEINFLGRYTARINGHLLDRWNVQIMSRFRYNVHAMMGVGSRHSKKYENLSVNETSAVDCALLK